MDDHMIGSPAASASGRPVLLRLEGGGAGPARDPARKPAVGVASASGVTVAELQRAWRAIRDGRFSDGPRPLSWSPGGPVLPVLGAHGGSGATTLALALATSAAPARVVECAPLLSSGLVAAANAELGVCADGAWLRGSRGQVLIEHNAAQIASAAEVPLPAHADRHALSLTVVDAAWEPTSLLGGGGSWLSGLVVSASCVVVTAVATVPGVRRLEGTLGMLAGRCVVAGVLGPAVKRWPRAVTASTGPMTRRLLGVGRVVPVPELAGLRTAGLTPDCLPAALVAAAGEVLRVVGDLTSSIADVEDET